MACAKLYVALIGVTFVASRFATSFDAAPKDMIGLHLRPQERGVDLMLRPSKLQRAAFGDRQ